MDNKMKSIAEKILQEIEDLLMEEDKKDYETRAPKFMEVKTNDPKMAEKVVDSLEEEIPEEEEEEELFPGKRRKLKI